MNVSAPARWNRFAQLLHWLIALLIVGLATVGLLMVNMSASMDKLKVFALHKSIGITVLMLVGLRLVWRLATRHPPEMPGPAWQRWSARGVHGALYVLMFVMPLSGWLYNSAANSPLQWFGLFNLPAIWAADPVVKHWAVRVHEYGFWTLAILVIIHAGAALKHHYFDRDETLRRMLPGIPLPNPEGGNP
ncbi:MAG: cytochrome b [Lysobacteraceae bacterium]